MEFIDFLLHFLKDPLTVITQLIDQYNTLIYFILFLVVFVETGFVIMPLLPGDSMLFAIGVIAATTGKLSLVIIIPLLILAALLGDNLNYFVGHKFGELIKEKKKILFLKREYIEKTEDFFEKNGGKAVIMARFVPIVRTIAPFVAGAGSMKYRNYIINCILGAILWVAGITLMGYFLGQFDIVKNNFEKVVLGIVLLSILPIFIKIFKSKFTKA
ncbi:cytochrome O ubiquinol oxidase [Flavobacterium sp. F372]|jgi:membrane-associated protein|uniref:VTT domain-containing protein n=1 Tax=Flavobacterium bernardetii TaxID=2813823 RepID=A0ABR7IUV6_9FLAO|nr:VTT domain-containing protein [Flavobacterium bernardetii]MBC5833564.1 VTT domain-containing protein [Flavobacterium bernardetii]NHF68796.1 cytochrome O ubiquinol oxidase [Flavobacterium bernardetii]